MALRSITFNDRFRRGQTAHAATQLIVDLQGNKGSALFLESRICKFIVRDDRADSIKSPSLAAMVARARWTSLWPWSSVICVDLAVVSIIPSCPYLKIVS